VTILELAERAAAIAARTPDLPVILWNDLNGSSGDAQYLTDTDGQVTICGEIGADQ